MYLLDIRGTVQCGFDREQEKGFSSSYSADAVALVHAQETRVLLGVGMVHNLPHSPSGGGGGDRDLEGVLLGLAVGEGVLVGVDELVKRPAPGHITPLQSLVHSIRHPSRARILLCKPRWPIPNSP